MTDVVSENEENGTTSFETGTINEGESVQPENPPSIAETRKTPQPKRPSHQSVTNNTSSLRGLIRELSNTTVTKPTLLGRSQCSAIVVNYISTGYILLPYGKNIRKDADELLCRSETLTKSIVFNS